MTGFVTPLSESFASDAPVKPVGFAGSETTAQLSELGKKSMAIDRLKHELNEKTATVLALEARESTTREQLRTTEQEYSFKSNKIQDIKHALSGKEAELGKLTAAVNERAAASDSQRVEIAALKTQIEQMKAQIDRAEKDLKETGLRRDQDHKAAEAAAQELAQEMAAKSGRAVLYVATATAGDEEMTERIARHRAARRGCPEVARGRWGV